MGYKLLLLSAFIACLFLFSFRADKKKKIVFFGDSITQAAVKKGGFIDLMQTMLQQKGMDQNYELIGAGIGGNKIYDLYLRMEEDVLAKKPDVVVVYVGVNDVWHKSSYGTGTDFDKFGKFYDAVVKKIQNQNFKQILRNKLNSKESKIESYLSIVTKYRNMKNKLKSEEGTMKKNEMPKIEKTI